jgi:hypothetical protein
MWNALITQAITNKKMIEVNYHGNIRLVEPHVLGYRKNNKLELLVWQVQNFAESATPEWRSFQLTEIMSISLTSQSFNGSRQTNSPFHSNWSQIIAKVS